MEDSFRVRVNKAFGSLASSSASSSSTSIAAPSSSLNSLWCLTDEEIERNEWNRDKDTTQEPEMDSFPLDKGFLTRNREKFDMDLRLELEKDLDDLDDDLDDEQSRASSNQSLKPKPNDYNDEEWEIKNSIGMDCTLDYEEEEDEYDKVAVGKEKAGDRMYMRDITGYGIETGTNNELPDSFKDIPRDPRANHIAAKFRLKEDAEAAKTIDSLQEEEDEYDKVAVGKEKAGDHLYMRDITDYGIETDNNNELPDSFMDIPRDPRANHIAAKLRLKEDSEAAKKMDSLQVSEQDSAPVVDDQVQASEDGNLKSILKRRDDESDSKSKNNQLDSKSQKRVRFDPECKDGSDKESNEVRDVHMEIDSEDKSLVYRLPPDYPSGIPDYMRNPSKYTRYTFDSSNELDEQSNRQAYMDFLKMLKKSNTEESQPADASGDHPKSVIFIPKRKVGDAIMTDNLTESKQSQDDASKGSLQRRGLSIGIAAVDTEESELFAMEEDEPNTVTNRRNGSQRPDRKYRTKARLETDEPN